MNVNKTKPCPFCDGVNLNFNADDKRLMCDTTECNGCGALVPSAEWSARADGWIGAKLNPPQKSCQVIAEWSNGDVEQSSYITDWGKPHFQRKCGTDENGTGWKGNVGYVVNWMPLPKAKSCGE